MRQLVSMDTVHGTRRHIMNDFARVDRSRVAEHYHHNGPTWTGPIVMSIGQRDRFVKEGVQKVPNTISHFYHACCMGLVVQKESVARRRKMFFKRFSITRLDIDIELNWEHTPSLFAQPRCNCNRRCCIATQVRIQRQRYSKSAFIIQRLFQLGIGYRANELQHA